MKEKVLELIYNHGEERSENFGVTVVEIETELSVTNEELTELLNEMYKNREIIVRKTPYNSLIFYNYDTDSLKKLQA